jgi:putative DNA primase/helicase
VTWDGKRWSKDRGGALVLYAVETARAIFRDAERVADEEEQKKISEWAILSQSLERLKAMWTLAKADLAVSPEELDTDPMLLNVENGTIDLRAGALKRHDRADRITKLAPVRYDPKAKAPRFMRFLKQVLVDDELIAFVQRFLGYSLTGSTEERALAVLHGVGKNGKSTLVELFIDLMGDYAAAADAETIMRQKFAGSARQYQLAELKGVRFVALSETRRGAQLEESVVKQITGNDTINARAPYGRPFTYRPQFALWLSTNHKPEIPDGSEAIWDRMKLIPFTQRFDGRKADPKLPEKLREELSGVLTWAVMGAVSWHNDGLGTSAAVEAATAQYREETDVIDRFFNDMCVFGPDKWVSKSDLFEAWEAWAIDEGVTAGAKDRFTTVMKERGIVKGFQEKRTKKLRFWEGIAVTSESAVTEETPAKHGGKVEKVTPKPDLDKLSSRPPRVEKVSENSGSAVTLSPGDSGEFEFDGLGEN